VRGKQRALHDVEWFGFAQDCARDATRDPPVLCKRGTKEEKVPLYTAAFSWFPHFVCCESLCYAHGNICKLCGWFGNPWRAGVRRDPGLFSPWFLFFFVCLALGIRKFLPWQFSFPFWPSWVSETWWREQDARGERSLSGHILDCSVSALPGFLVMVYWLRSAVYCLF